MVEVQEAAEIAGAEGRAVPVEAEAEVFHLQAVALAVGVAAATPERTAWMRATSSGSSQRS